MAANLVTEVCSGTTITVPGTTSMMNLKKSAFLQQFFLDFKKCLELEIRFIKLSSLC